MDNATVQRIARLKIHLRAEQGVLLNTQRFFTDREYAEQIIDSAEESSNLEFVTLAMQLRRDMGWLASAAPASAPATAAKLDPASTTKTRYQFGARSL